MAGSQTLVDLRTQAKSVDFSAAGSTKPMQTGSSLPSNCAVGQFFFLTSAPAGSNVYACNPANTWTVEGSLTVNSATANEVLSSNGSTIQWLPLGGDVSGTPGGLTVNRLQGRNVSGTAPAGGQVLQWNAAANQWQPAAASAGNSSYAFVSQVSITIPGSLHQFGTTNLVVDCYDNSVTPQRVEPDKIQISASTYDVTVNFSTAQSGYCVVNGAGTASVGGGSGAVGSVFGRTGIIVPMAGDYDFAQLSGTAAASQMPAALDNTTSVNGTSIPANATLLTTTSTLGGMLAGTPGNASLAQNRALLNQAWVWSGSAWQPASVANSVFGRSGAITAQSGDYSFSQISGTASIGQIPFATTSTNLSGGTPGAIPYQSAGGTTSMLAGNTTAIPCVIREIGTGSAARAPVCLPDNLNVRDYGAAGDGSTDDTAAIQNANAALVSGQCLVFPAGTYKVTSPLTPAGGTCWTTSKTSTIYRWDVNAPPSGATIAYYGSGPAAINFDLSSASGLAGYADSWSMYGLVIEGANATGTTDGLVLKAKNAGGGIYGIQIHDSTFRNFPGNQVAISGTVWDVSFHRTSFLNPARASNDLVSVTGDIAAEVTFDDCYFANYTAGTWAFNGEVTDLRFINGTIAPQATTSPGANGIYATGGLQVHGTHLENVRVFSSVGIRYSGTNGALLSPSNCGGFAEGIQIGDPGNASAAVEGAVVMGLVRGVPNTIDIHVIPGGTRAGSKIINTGYFSPVILNERETVDGIYTDVTYDYMEDYRGMPVRSAELDIANPATVGPQSLTNPNLTGGATWSATGDCSLTSNTAVCTYSTGGTSTITQTQANLAISGAPNAWYAFTYTVSNPTGNPLVTISTGWTVNAYAATLTMTAGTWTTYFRANSSPGDFVITTNYWTSGQSFTLSALSLKQITAGNAYIAGTVYAGALQIGNQTFAPNVTTMLSGDLACAHAADTTILSQSITGGFSTSTVITLTVANANGYQPGDIIGVQGTNTTVDGGPYTVTTPTTNTIPFSSTANPGSLPAGGTVFLWCGNQSNDTVSATPYHFATYTVPANTLATAGSTLSAVAGLQWWSGSATNNILLTTYWGTSGIFANGSATALAASQAASTGSLSLSLRSRGSGWIDAVPTGEIIPSTATGGFFINSNKNPFNVGTGSAALGMRVYFQANGAGAPTYSSGVTGTGTGKCVYASANGAGSGAQIQLSVSSGTVSSTTTLLNTGVSYTSEPTTWSWVSGAACSGTATTTGGSLGGPQGYAVRQTGLVTRIN